MNFKQNEEAVSPVIGVILMVAITVILAAVIAAFVFGMTGNVQTSKTIAVTVGQNADNVVLTYQGGPDAVALNSLRIDVVAGNSSADESKKYLYVNDNTPTVVEFKETAPADGTSFANIPVGTTKTILTCASAQQDHVVITGHFADGSDQVVLDTYV